MFRMYTMKLTVNSLISTPESAEGAVYCEDGCHAIKPKYGMPKVKKVREGTRRRKRRCI